MKTTKYITLALIALINLTACSSDDDSVPDVINEEEVITTITVTLSPETGNGNDVTLTSRDLDGDGPNPPVLDVSGALQSGMLYSGSILLQNETVSPAEVINEEIEEESDEHQFFYQVSSGLNLTASYTDNDDNGRPIGLDFELQAGAASTGQFTIILRHEPNKDAAGVSDGDITNAGGETDIAQTFQVEIQ